MQRVNTPLTPPRLAFAGLCALGILAIAYGAALELTRQKRGNTLVSTSQYRIRLVSAAIWLTILSANFYAVTALWPVARYLPGGRLTPASKAEATLFIQVIGGSFSLVFVAFFLFILDLRQTRREREALERKRQSDFAELTRTNLARPDPAVEDCETPLT